MRNLLPLIMLTTVGTIGWKIMRCSRIVILIVIFLGEVVFASLSALAAGDHVKAFYAATAAELAGPPGSLIRAERWDMHTAYWVRAWRILYRSTGLDGEPIAVSAAVIIPEFPVPPARSLPGP